MIMQKEMKNRVVYRGRNNKKLFKAIKIFQAALVNYIKYIFNRTSAWVYIRKIMKTHFISLFFKVLFFLFPLK